MVVYSCSAGNTGPGWQNPPRYRGDLAWKKHGSHIALNVQNRDELAEYYKRVFGLEEKYRGPNGTIYLSDGFVGLALISRPDIPWGINHFGFQVEDVPAIEEATHTTAVSNTFGAVAESWIPDPDGNRVDITEHGWPI
jgi:catechol 2,3-dioxygenase-like lactoylglutathione lyase family enzyme